MNYFMTINIFVLKGDLNGKIVVVRFFFCWVYVYTSGLSILMHCVISLPDATSYGKKFSNIFVSEISSDWCQKTIRIS